MKGMTDLFLILILLMTAGCVTTYSAERTIDGATTNIDVRTWREFPGGIKIHYNRETGTFDLEAGEVTSGSETDAIRDIVLALRPLGDGG